MFSEERASQDLFSLGCYVELRGTIRAYTIAGAQKKDPHFTASLSVVLSKGVQQLMDELDLPPDRANLFEVEVSESVRAEFGFVIM